MKKILISLLIVVCLTIGCKKEEKIIEVVKKEVQETNKYNNYFERDNRIIYFSSNLEEVYFKGNTLKDYISKSYQTMDDSLKSITELMEHISTIKDGGTQLYRSEKYDLTVITCNRIRPADGINKDVFIGDYKLEFDNDMCNR